MKRILIAIFLFIVVLSVFGCANSSNQTEPRGLYVYDATNRLSTESLLVISSRLWQMDTKTGYELIVVLPNKVMAEDEVIAWFNSNGVGKKDKNNGAAIFIYPDNTWFVSIGQGNDAISVPYSKTYGDKILTIDNLKSDLSLTLIRYIEVLRTQVETTNSKAILPVFWDTLKPNIPMILLWALLAALIVLLIQQKNGFQVSDLAIPFVIMVLLGIFIGFSAISQKNEPTTYQGFGVVTESKQSTHNWVEMRVVSTGKTTYTIPVNHTDYINDTTIKDYDLKGYSYRFKTTDSKGAWDIKKGQFLSLTIAIENGNLYYVNFFSSNSGGQTIGDGVSG